MFEKQNKRHAERERQRTQRINMIIINRFLVSFVVFVVHSASSSFICLCALTHFIQPFRVNSFSLCFLCCLLCLWVFGKPNDRRKNRRVSYYVVLVLHTHTRALNTMQDIAFKSRWRGAFGFGIRHSFFRLLLLIFPCILFGTVANQNKIPQPNATAAYSASLAISLLVSDSVQQRFESLLIFCFAVSISALACLIFSQFFFSLFVNLWHVNVSQRSICLVQLILSSNAINSWWCRHRRRHKIRCRIFSVDLCVAFLFLCQRNCFWFNEGIWFCTLKNGE